MLRYAVAISFLSVLNGFKEIYRPSQNMKWSLLAVTYLHLYLRILFLNLLIISSSNNNAAENKHFPTLKVIVVFEITV